MVARVSAPFDELITQRRAWIARASLAELVTVVGRPGLTVAADRPQLLAQVDQHAAAVRESLGYGDGPIDEVALAGYATAIRDAALASGCTLDPLQQDWVHPSWELLRLLAICSLVHR